MNASEKLLNSDIFGSAEYKRSRAAYAAQCTFEYFIEILISDAYLAKLLTDIGLSDGVIGIISSLVSAAFLFQLISIFLAESITNVKRSALILSTCSELAFCSLYAVPFLDIPKSFKTILIFAGILIGYLCLYSITSIIYKWANSFVHPEKRASFSAGKEMLSLFSGIVFTFIAGQVIDRLEAQGRLHDAFLFIAAVGLFITLLNFISLALIAGKVKHITEEHTEKKHSKSFGEIIGYVVHNRSLINVIILSCLWSTARYMTIGFMGVYKTKDLLLTVGTVQIINIAANFCRFILSKPIGKFSDKTSYARGILLGLILAAAAFGVNIFTTPSTVWCVVVYTIFYNVGMAGTNANFFNIVYSYVEPDYFVAATAIKNSVSGIVGFCASLIGSRILEAVSSNGNSLFGIELHGQQLLSAISFVIVIAAMIFTRKVVERQKAVKR